MYDQRLSDSALKRIISDISHGWYSDVQISAFLSSCAGERLDKNEVVGLTRAMIEIGDRLSWPSIDAVYDKHCIGGLPGNRTTPIVVAICSAAGLIMPKTSSRAITSPAGTADVMDVLTRVDLDMDDIRRTVELAGGCLAWGGAVRLSPVDDLLIRVERALDLDSKGQLVASVLSKKIAAGSTHILIDIPVGKTAKVRDNADAESLADLFRHVGELLGVHIEYVFSDGSQPIGHGIGPALEARDVVNVLCNHENAPADLREKSLDLCARLLAMANHGDSPHSNLSNARQRAETLLQNGAAWQQFEKICRTQGRFDSVPEAPHRKALLAHQNGVVSDIDNRRIARLAKLAGAPRAVSAGLELFVHLGDTVKRGDPLLTIHAESEGELDYALLYYLDNRDMIRVGVTLNGHADIATALANRCDVTAGNYSRRQFPDGETYLRIDTPVANCDVIILCGLEQPDNKFLPLVFFARQLKEMGARSVGLVTPYLAYMRQDRRFMDGEALTSRHFAQLLCDHVDWMVTVDPHLHRYHSLSEIYRIPTRALQAASLLAQFVRNQGDIWLLGPDEESAQWVSVMAETAGVPWAVARKERRGDRDVHVTLPDTSVFTDRRAMLVDDVISSGHTMQRALLALKQQGFHNSDCLCIHGLFADNSDTLLKDAGAARLISCNSILHPSNLVDLGPMIAEAVAELLP